MNIEYTNAGGGLNVAGQLHLEQWRGRTYTEIPTWKEFIAQSIEWIMGRLGRTLTAAFGRPLARATYWLRHREIVQFGWLADQWDVHNMITQEGLAYALGCALDGSTTQITAWYLGLIDEVGGTPDGTETYAATVWEELETYDESTRVAWVDAAMTGTTTKSIANSGTPAVFTINATDDYYGVGMFGGGGAASTKGDHLNSGTLFSSAYFATAKTLDAADTLTVTYTFTATNAA